MKHQSNPHPSTLVQVRISANRDGMMMTDVMWQCAVFCDMSRMLSRCHKIRCDVLSVTTCAMMMMSSLRGYLRSRWTGVTRDYPGVTCDDVWGADPETGGGTHYCFCFFDRVFSISSWILLYSSVMIRWWEIVCPDARTLIIQDKLVSISKNKTSLFNPWPPPRGLRHHDYRQWNQFYKTIIKRRLEL